MQSSFCLAGQFDEVYSSAPRLAAHGDIAPAIRFVGIPALNGIDATQTSCLGASAPLSVQHMLLVIQWDGSS